MKNLMIALRFKIFMTVLLGLVYPFAMTGVSQVIFPDQANGQLIRVNNQVVGSKLIAQNFEKPEYFWPRPSATSYNPLPSGGSNLSQSAQSLKQIVEERKAKLKAVHPDQSTEPPQDLLFASGSGVDPHISYEAAQYQLSRVAKARNMDVTQVQRLLESQTDHRQFGILGEKTVNVLTLNLALDHRE